MGKKRKAQNNAVKNEVKKEKTKKIKVNEDLDNDSNKNATTSVQSTRNVTETSSNRKSKRIVFVDDEPQEAPVPTSKEKEAPKKDSQQFNHILTDDDVKDEDIDKFCDELNEEDNKQYENWVQLLEANLNSIKKKSKYLEVLLL